MLGPRPAESFGRQAAEVLRRTLWILPVELLLSAALTALGVNEGNAGADEIEAMVRRNALSSIAFAGVLAPALEEAIFRWLPSQLSNLVLRRFEGMRWALGLSMAVAFAAIHNLKTEPGLGSVQLLLGMHLDISTLPATQFVFGILLWDLMRRYGLWACAFSHMLHNSILLGLALLYLKGTP